MRTRRHKHIQRYSGGKRRGTRRNKSSRSGKKWVTAIQAAQSTLNKTGSIEAARKSLRKQALTNARKLFGSVSI
ncbi:MAG: hypothetical protein ACOVRN_07500 [Flavobacterium sp.]